MSIEMGLAQEEGLGAFALPSLPTSDSYKVSQEDIPAGKTAGVLFEYYILNNGRVFGQKVYDGVFRPAFAELGYEMSDSVMGTEAINLVWQIQEEHVDMEGNPMDADPFWNLRVVGGPQRLIGEYFDMTNDDPATHPAVDTVGRIRSVYVYRVLLRPRDELLTLAKVKTLTRKVNELGYAIGQNSDQRARANFIVKGVNPIPTHAALWLSLIGLGAVGIVSAAHKRK